MVRIPGGKHVIVDAGAAGRDTSMRSRRPTTTSARGTSPTTRARYETTSRSSAKQYWRQFEPSPDFVVMFLPDESYLRAAHEHDPALAEDAWRANVILASRARSSPCCGPSPRPGSRRRSPKAREVHALGRELYERIGKVGDHLAKLGRSLNSTVGAYNEAVGSLETRVLVTARSSRSTASAGSSRCRLSSMAPHGR